LQEHATAWKIGGRARRVLLDAAASGEEDMNRLAAFLARAGAAAVVVGALGAGTAVRAAPATDTLKFGYVPGYDTAILFMGQERGTFAAHGIKLELHAIDAGPSVITSVINGAYDLASAAPFPILIAFSHGAPLRAVTQYESVEPNKGDSGLLVLPGSPIKGYRDLDGKNIATNALTSLTTLAIKAAVDASGGHSSTLKITALPFLQSNQAVKQKQADASVVISPFLQLGVADGLVQIGDPIADYIPNGVSYGMIFASANTLAHKGKAVARFVAALGEVEAYANAHPDQLLASAIKNVKLDPKLAAKLPVPKYDSKINRAALQKLADLMGKYHYLAKPVNLSTFLSAQ
jgi:NitT/TauT family transport system substrate-binding protein